MPPKLPDGYEKRQYEYDTEEPFDEPDDDEIESMEPEDLEER